MKYLLLVVTFLFTINGYHSMIVKKCTNYLPGSGVDVDTVTNTVTFPTSATPKPASKIALSYNSKGLDAFFNLAKSFMNTVQKKDFPTVKDANGKFKVKIITDAAMNRKGEIWDFELPIVIAVGIGIVLAILFPIVGFCFCCCRCCCNKCGGEMIQSKENSEAHYKCCIYSFVLFLITVFMLVGVLMMYVTNNNLNAEAKKSPTVFQNTLDEAMNFLSTTKKELQEITVNKTNCLYEDLIVPDISDQGVRTQIGVKLYTMIKPHVDGPLNAVREATSNVTSMNAALNLVSNTSAKLKDYTVTLEQQLAKARSDLQEIQTNCSTIPVVNETCANIGTNNLKQEANFTNLPNVDSELANIRNILNQNFSGSVDKAFKVFQDIPDTVVSRASPSLTNIRKLAKDGKDKLVNQTSNIYKSLDNVLNKRSDFDYKSKIEKNLKFDDYRFYAFIGLSALISLIILCLMCGLACGICGYDRGTDPAHRSSSSHHGGNCLMAAVGFMFLFAFIVFLFTAIFMFFGEHFHIACRELKNAEIIAKYVDLKVNVDGSSKKINIPEILKNCRMDMPVYTAIGGKSIYDMDKQFNITQMLNFDKDLEAINVDVSDQSVLSNSTRKSLNDLKNSNVNNINFTKFLNELQKNIVAVDLITFSNDLKNKSGTIRAYNTSEAISLADSLDRVAADLVTIQNVTIANITAESIILKGNIDDLKMRASDLSNVTDNVLKQLEGADNYIKVTASSEITTLVKNYADRVIGWPKQFVTHVFSEVKNNLAKCKPFANIYDGFVNVFFCTGIILNFNGFWVAMGWCIFFFPFAIIFGVRLAKYFRRMQITAGFDQ
eukprot:gene5496-6181_t